MLTLLALRIREWLASRRRREEMRCLLGREDRLLSDIGVTRSEIAAGLGRRPRNGAQTMGLLGDIYRHSARALGLAEWL